MKVKRIKLFLVRQPKVFIFTIILFYFLYLLFFIVKTTFVLHGTHYYVLFDDEMVSMRYARNLAHGFGLIWNPGGEHVEGYTNFLWTLYMAFWHLFPIPLAVMSLPIQLTNVFLSILNLIFVYKIVKQLRQSEFVALLSIIFTATYFPLNNWAVLGTEVTLLTLITSVVVFLSCLLIKKREFFSALFILLGIATLVRLDMFVPAVIVSLFLYWQIPQMRKKILFVGAPIILLFLFTQTIFRILYYGEILPNTYYLKITGYPLFFRISRGAWAALRFITGMNWILFLFPFVMLFRKSNKIILLLFFLFIGQVLYSLYVGGDVWEYFGGANRYIAIVMPLFFILLSLSIDSIRLNIIKNYKRYKIINAMIIGFVFVCVLQLNAVSADSLQQAFWFKKLSTVGGNKINLERAGMVDVLTNKDATIAVVWAGTIPYFADRYTADLLGKSDAVIAHQNSHVFGKSFTEKLTAFTPGHTKWDYRYSIGKLKPDIVAQIQTTEGLQPYIDAYSLFHFEGFDFYLRKNSKKINWNAVALYAKK